MPSGLTNDMRFAIGIEYYGSGFQGWQRQRGGRSVQGCVEQALGRVANQPVTVVTAGRTDTGVHATGLVAHFDTASQRSHYSWQRGANSFLPDDVAVTWVSSVPDDFHARFSALSRCYRYVILNRKTRSAVFRDLATWDYRPLNTARMQNAANSLIGEHDFSGFRAAGCQARSATRTLYKLDVHRHGAWICIDVCANAFLQHMVRNLVGVLTAIGAGEQPEEWATEVLVGRDRRLGGVTAPPCGLYLTTVEYPAHIALPEPPEPVRFW